MDTENKLLLGGVGVLVLAIVITLCVIYLKPKSEGFDATKVSSSTKIVSSDNNGNLNPLPNLLNDLQLQLDDLNKQIAGKTGFDDLTNQLVALETRKNNIINGITPLQNTKVSGILTTDALRVLSAANTSTLAPSTTSAPTNKVV